jgi:type II secretory pathway component PulM
MSPAGRPKGENRSAQREGASVSLRGTFASWRSRASPREQALVSVGALLVVATLAWAFVLDPLAGDQVSTDAALGEARAAHAQARTQRDELAVLAQSAPQPTGADARGAVERVLVQHGLRAAVTAQQATAARVEITFEAVDFAALTALVEALGREARLFPVEALLAARTVPGSVRAEIAFAP